MLLLQEQVFFFPHPYAILHHVETERALNKQVSV